LMPAVLVRVGEPGAEQHEWNRDERE